MLDQKDLNELSIGDEFTLFLIVNKSEIKTSKTGKSFLNLELRDRSIMLPAKVWDNAESSFLKLREGSIAKVAGVIEEFNGAPQIRIEKWRVAASEDDVTPEDFLPKSRRAISVMVEEFESLINSINNHYLRRLLQNIFTDENLRKYTRVPAGKAWHHAYIHGLLEHTLEIARICDLMCNIHPEINRDLLICGALLHDFGKTEELTYDTAFDYSDKGKLLGHIMIGAIAVENAASEIDTFPIELKERLLHLVLSHQGKLEYASPVEPKTLEAIVLYQADELSAKTNAYKSAIEAEKNKNSKWTKFLPLANTSLMITEEFTKE
ncbi:MAG: metal dependent phosphohydrolase [Ignavibacteria bacterium]|nr:MAG: metal dependent phosphohydrolase [Ignavibacteria bacterium]KAF0158873.1 MAG: metal dependent phosphohydrolase [Ignavibacteria bacterium]